MHVAFIGLGKMGSPMAAHIARAGNSLTVYNRTRVKAEDLAAEVGAVVADSPRAAVAGANIVITMLADESALRTVCDGADGLLVGLTPGAIVIDMGTTGPAGVGRLGVDVADRGCVLLDAPVSGSTATAEAGALTIMVGGPASEIDAVLPVLRTMGERIYVLGDTGSGAAMKLAVNLVIFGLGQALSEALVLAEASGIDREQAYEVFENSAVGAPMVKYRHEAFIRPESTPAAFALTLAAKDLKLITDLAQAVGTEVPQSVANLDVVERAIDAGFADADMAAVSVYLRDTSLAR